MRFNAAPFFTDLTVELSIYFLKGFSKAGTRYGSDSPKGMVAVGYTRRNCLQENDLGKRQEAKTDGWIIEDGWRLVARRCTNSERLLNRFTQGIGGVRALRAVENSPGIQFGGQGGQISSLLERHLLA